MAHRHLNLLDRNQSNFTDRNRSSLGGWEVTSSNTAAARSDRLGFYSTYNPNYPDTYVKNSAGVYTTDSVAAMEFKSPWLVVEPSTLYMFTLLVTAQVGGFNIFVEAEGNSSASDSGATVIDTSSALSLSEGNGARLGVGVSNGAGSGETSYQFIRLVVRATNSGGGNIPASRFIWLYDPVFGEYGITKAGNFTRLVYDDFPSFMQLDDKNINDFTTSTQPVLPLFRFTESMCFVLDHISDEALDYVYVRATEGTESKSKLVDPATASAGALPWLATVTGTTLLTASSGFTPWLG